MVVDVEEDLAYLQRHDGVGVELRIEAILEPKEEEEE
jgi:hypothetical protein